MKRVGLISLVLVLALGTLGVGYAAWTDTLYISGTVTTGSVEWEFSGIPGQGDAGLDWNCFFDLDGGEWVLMDKDVASTTVAYEAGEEPHHMTVTIDNAYPYYGNHINFAVHGLGSIPLRIWKVEFVVDSTVVETIYDEDEYIYLDLGGDGADDLEIWWGNGFGEQLHECDRWDISFELLVLQEAPQDSTLTFTIKLYAIQWDEYTPGPLL